MNEMAKWLSTIALTVCLLYFHGLIPVKAKGICEVIFIPSGRYDAHPEMGITLISFSRLQTVTDSVTNTSCECYLDSVTATTTSAIKVWTQPQNETLHLQVCDTESTKTCQDFQVLDKWETTFINTRVKFSVAVNESNAYSLILQVNGNYNNVSCAGSAHIDNTESTTDVKKGEVFKSNTELLFETPLLIIGAAMAVFGFLLIISGIAVWRRYRKEHRKQEMVMQMTEIPQDI